MCSHCVLLHLGPSLSPSRLSGDVRSSTLVVFTWVAPPAIDQNGVINHYVVKLREINTDVVWSFVAVDEDISIGSLHPFYYYECTVAASTSVGTGPRSTAVRVQMDEEGLDIIEDTSLLTMVILY